MYVDSHAHLNDDLLYPEADAIIQRAKNAGIDKIVCAGYDKSSNNRAIELARKHSMVYAAIGFHPEYAADTTEDDLAWLKANCHQEKVVAIGEIGLDYHWDKTSMEKQKELFARQIGIAEEANLPIVVHMRDATEDALSILKNKKSPGFPGVMHCFSGSVESAEAFMKTGMFISLAGTVTFKNARQPKEVALSVDLEKLLIETDSPYLAPAPYRGKTNEPAYVVKVAEEIAKIKGLPVETVAAKTSANAERLFGFTHQ